MKNTDTIAAPATPLGRGGIGIIRVSGDQVKFLAQQMFGAVPKPRVAQYQQFKDENDSLIDIGLVLYFPAPHSFTGEDILEFHGHGGPVVLNSLLRRIMSFNIRLAKPGEFSERAFLNNKIDLTQAEAIADLIDSASEQAARLAIRSLQGEFSQQIKHCVDQLTQLRMFVEAAIDFSEEEIDFLTEGSVAEKLHSIIDQIQQVKQVAKQGAVLREGMTLVIAGYPNAGKSTLLNKLCGREIAIVSDIPGTTRDVMRERIVLDGIPLQILDTAGIRDSQDVIEREGVRRAWDEINNADQLLLIVDSQERSDLRSIISEFRLKLNTNIPITIAYNKIDISGLAKQYTTIDDHPVIYLSAKSGEGIELLKDHLKQAIGFSAATETMYLARTRHLDALDRAFNHLSAAKEQLQTHRAAELLAEDFRQAQIALGEITGEFTADDLLGKIFSSFCIGK